MHCIIPEFIFAHQMVIFIIVTCCLSLFMDIFFTSKSNRKKQLVKIVFYVN